MSDSDPQPSAPPPVIVWFRRDLRVADNPALLDAVATGAPVVPVYICDDETPGRWAPGTAARWWLRQSLNALGGTLDRLGSPLVLRCGRAQAALAELVGETGAQAVVWNRAYEPHAVARDKAVSEEMARIGVAVRTFNAALLYEPWEVTTEAGSPYRQFAHFHRRLLALPPPPAPLPAPTSLSPPARRPISDVFEDWVGLAADSVRCAGLAATWAPGEAAAAERLARFIDESLASYHASRNDPGRDGTSRLSPYLTFGELGPRQVVHAVRTAPLDAGADAFLRELAWREFCRHLLHYAPDLPDQPLKREFAAFPWTGDEAGLIAWRQGATGFPIVDAGMRELFRTGWLPNRLRMIVASFLVKDLLLPWQAGEAWFWDALVDADLASNAVNWQWVAGCGIDAAPYFRIFNPVVQGEKFDPRGRYVRRWVPELVDMPDMFIHRPWEAPPEMLARARVTLGRDYPAPIVDHASARRRALSAYQQVVREGAA